MLRIQLALRRGKKNTHAPQKVAYPSEHDPRENKWLRLAKERSKL
jgi:hypothetical protein